MRYSLQLLIVSAISAFCFSCTNYQEADAPDTLSVDVTELSFSSGAASRSVTVQSGTKWTVNSKPEWVSVQSISSSAGSFQWGVNFSVTENNGYDREGIITISSGSGSASINVSQQGKEGKYVAVESVSVSPATLAMTEGETKELLAVLSPSTASVKTVTWKSLNTAVATVDENGTVTAVAAGEATIRVTTEDGGKTADCVVTVKAKTVSVTGVSLDRTTLTLTVGESATLTATVTPENATNKEVTWSSNKTDVATVSASGVVTAKAAGNATITVTTADGSKKATCAVTVKASVIHVTCVTLDKTSLSLEEGDTYPLIATVTPSNATDKSVSWVSNNTDVATVSSTGFVTAVSPGTAAITVKTNDESKIATCVVIVSKKVISVTGVALNHTSLTLTEGETQNLVATVSPSNASNKDVTWTSNNTNVATVSSSGVVTAKKAGTATITVTTVDGNKTAACSVTVQAAVVPVTGVTLDNTSLTMTEGDTQTLVATIAPSNASNKDVTWSSNNTTVATVSSSGVVTAKKAGTARITVTTADGGKTATCNVTVNARQVPVTGVTLNMNTLVMTEGDTQSLVATVTPTNATNKNVTWSSNNTTVATVSNSGVVTAKKAGSATITVTTEDGGKTASCVVTVNEQVVAVTGVSLDHTTLSMTEGDTQTLVATITPANATNQDVTWSSNNTTVATVSSSGVVTAKKAGSATITVTTSDGGKKATCAVTVSSAVIPVTGVSLNNTSLTMEVGDTQTLVATVSPSNATNKSVTWSSSDTNVVTVSSSGVVTAKASGYATITVTTVNGAKTATCDVAVVVPVTGVSLNHTSLTMNVGATQTLTATVSPSNATNKSVTWSSNNTSVATVSSSGVVTAKAAGSATITVTTNDGAKAATCNVTVVVPVSGVSLDYTSLTLTEGQTQTLKATITPSNATNKDVTWSSNNTTVATVSSSGVVTAKKAGTATITVTTVDGSKKATCSVTVNAASVPVTGVSLNQTSLTLTEGQTQTLTATVSPSNATNKSVTWSSSNTTVATVSSSGVVTAKKAGTATITVTTVDGSKTATCSVTVNAASIPVTGVSLNQTSLTLTEGQTQTLTATVSPSNATNKNVTWTSNNTTVATVSSSGVVTAKKAGTATITVTTEDGSKKATCSVTVKSKDIIGSGNEGTGEEDLF